MFKDKVTQSVAEAAAKIMSEDIASVRDRIKQAHPAIGRHEDDREQSHKRHQNKMDALHASSVHRLSNYDKRDDADTQHHSDVHKMTLQHRDDDHKESQRINAQAANSIIGRMNKRNVKKEETEHMQEELKGNQSKIDKNHNNKIDAQDFKILKGQKKANEETEQLVEYETDKNGRYVHNAKAGKYGGSEKPQDPFAGVRGPKQSDLSAIEAEKRKKKKKFSEMVDTYQSGGIKELFKEMAIEEEASQEEFNAELEKQKKKASGTATDADKAQVAKPAVAAVQQENTETEIQVINADIANGVDTVNIAERELTGGEMNKREEIVKSMKKGMAGFKERYGKDAKSVMYATATKQVKGE
jgi:hypothetical protein